MEIIVRCHPRRQNCIEYLAKHLPKETIFSNDINTDGHRKNFLKALGIAGKEAALHLEEDIFLTANFLDKAKAVINLYPEKVIQFFSMRKADLEIGSRFDRGSTFMMTQCFYLPSGYSALLLSHYPNWADKDKHISAVDIFTSDFLKSRKEKYYIFVPSLVDHRSLVSLIDKRRSRNRQSKTFQDGIYE